MGNFIGEVGAFVILTLILIAVAVGGSVQMNPLFLCKGFFIMFVAIWFFYGLGMMWGINGKNYFFTRPLVIASFICLVASIGMGIYLLGAAAGIEGGLE